MIPYAAYKVLHLIGIFLVLVPLGGITLHVINGGTREFPSRKFAAITHGIGMFLALVGGFGLLARLGIVSTWPTWVIIKLLVWLGLGIMPFFIYRRKSLSKTYWFSIFVLAGLAAYMAIYKPF